MVGTPITNIANFDMTEEELRQEKLDKLVDYISNHSDGLNEGMKLIQELHKGGILEVIISLLQAKEKVAKIAVDQMVRPPVTNMINNAMAAAGALTELNPDFTEKLVKGLANGVKKAEEGLTNGEKVGLVQLLKVMKDPDINRTMTFGIHLLKGIGEGLKD